MAPDLSALVRAAERAGMAGCRARMVPPDPRRGRWFGFPPGEILVSERVLERCPPPDAAALLVQAVLLRRRWTPTRRWLIVAASLDAALALAGCVLLALGKSWLGVALLVAGAGGVLGMGVAAAFLHGRAVLAADDEAVTLLGDATPLVRGLNLMNQDEIRLGGRRLPARPDLHRRAERLARVHRLCSGPAPAPRG